MSHPGQNKATWKSSIALLISSILCGVVLAFLFLGLGITLAGNFATNLKLGSAVGWEAGGVIGFLIGLGLGSFLGLFAASKLLHVKGSYVDSFLEVCLAVLILLFSYAFGVTGVEILILMVLPIMNAYLGFQFPLIAKSK